MQLTRNDYMVFKIFYPFNVPSLSFNDILSFDTKDVATIVSDFNSSVFSAFVSITGAWGRFKRLSMQNEERPNLLLSDIAFLVEL